MRTTIANANAVTVNPKSTKNNGAAAPTVGRWPPRPSRYARKAVTNVVRADAMKASARIGMGAIQASGQISLAPVERAYANAVARTAVAQTDHRGGAWLFIRASKQHAARSSKSHGAIA